MHWWEGSLLNQNMQYETVYLIFWGAMKWDLKFIFRSSQEELNGILNVIDVETHYLILKCDSSYFLIKKM